MEVAAAAETTADLKKIRWHSDMVQHLFNLLLQYKRSVTYENLGLDADKQMQYKELWIKWSVLIKSRPILFWYPYSSVLPENVENLDELEMFWSQFCDKRFKNLFWHAEEYYLSFIRYKTMLYAVVWNGMT